MTASTSVLLVEDNPADADFVREVLGDEGDSVVVAVVDRIATAISLLKTRSFDVCLLDLALPDSSGFRLSGLIALHAAAPRLPLVVLTGAPDERLGVEAVAAGAQDYLAKGHVSGKLLVRTLRYAIERAQLDAARVAAVSAAEAARKDAEEANTAKDEFLAVVSHELRTPLMAILGWASLLRGDQLNDERRRRALESIERNSRLQARLIDDILDVSRVVTGKLNVAPEAVDPVLAVDRAIDVVRLPAEANDVSIVADVRGLSISTIQVDDSRFQQILWNLLMNAIKFTPRGGVVQVSLRDDGDALKLTVADNGCGIDNEFIGHVFERFRQSEATRTRRHGGLGLGLSIVRHLVELHGGTVAAHSDGLGHGTRFVVRLPLRGAIFHTDAAQPRVKHLAAESNVVDLAGLVILVVEDDLDARDLLVTALEGLGARTLAAADVEEALAVLDAQAPDVLISDIGLGRRDGYDLISELRGRSNSNARIPAIALTAFGRSEDRLRALQAGFDCHFAKPILPIELLAAVGVARKAAALRLGAWLLLQDSTAISPGR